MFRTFRKESLVNLNSAQDFYIFNERDHLK